MLHISNKLQCMCDGLVFCFRYEYVQESTFVSFLQMFSVFSFSFPSWMFDAKFGFNRYIRLSNEIMIAFFLSFSIWVSEIYYFILRFFSPFLMQIKPHFRSMNASTIESTIVEKRLHRKYVSTGIHESDLLNFDVESVSLRTNG